jgi:RNA recognition motif-containing protein
VKLQTYLFRKPGALHTKQNISLIIHSKPEGPNSTELHRGFGYVEFEDPEDTKDAIDNMDQSELFGRVIKVSAAKPPKNVNEGLGSKTALWEQVGYLFFDYSLSWQYSC